ncbi:MAG TPA: SseB family protein [Jiangellaceae bacterium]
MTSDQGKHLPTNAFEGDDGGADPGVVAALNAHERGDGGVADVLSALASSRLLVPVVAVLDELEDEPTAPADAPAETAPPAADGLRAEKSSHMATVSTMGRDGRRGMLAFTSVESLRRWDAAARPVPVATRSAAEAALADGAEALVIDLAGPVVFAVDAPELRSLASGWRAHGAWAGAGRAAPAEVVDDHVNRRRRERLFRARTLAARSWRRVRSRPDR